jgi:hypothetical protein
MRKIADLNQGMGRSSKVKQLRFVCILYMYVYKRAELLKKSVFFFFNKCLVFRGIKFNCMLYAHSMQQQQHKPNTKEKVKFYIN